MTAHTEDCIAMNAIKRECRRADRDEVSADREEISAAEITEEEISN